MSAAVRPIHVLRAATLASLRQRAQAALTAWGSEWLSAWTENDKRIASLEARTACEAERSRSAEYQAIRTEAGCMWVRCSAADRLSFGCAVMGAELMPRAVAADDWVGAIAEHAWNLRNRALFSGLSGGALGSQTPPMQEAPAHLFAFGSGAVVLSCDVLGLHAIVDSSAWYSNPPNERVVAHPLPKLTPLDQAMQGALLRLDVILGGVEVELPKLLDLSHGDVLRLPQRLDQGIAVLCEGRPLARAILGEAHGRKCVQISTHDP